MSAAKFRRAARRIESSLDRAHGLACDMHCAKLASGLASARDLARDLLGLGLDVEDAVVVARDLARDIDRAARHLRALGPVPRSRGGRTGGNRHTDLNYYFNRASTRATNLARDLSLEPAAEVRKQRVGRQVVRSAAGLLAATARLLPAADRARFAEEYQSELWDLAQDGAGRIRQLQYALRQLCNARSTGSALRSPHRRSTVP